MLLDCVREEFKKEYTVIIQPLQMIDDIIQLFRNIMAHAFHYHLLLDAANLRRMAKNLYLNLRKDDGNYLGDS